MEYIELARGYTDQAFMFFVAVVVMFAGREVFLNPTTQLAVNDKCIVGCGERRATGSTACYTHKQVSRGKV